MKKKIISLFLAVVMIVGMLPLSAITAFAEGGTSETLTLRDILDTVGGTYSVDMSQIDGNLGKLTIHGEYTVKDNVICFEKRIFSDNRDGELVLATKTQYDADGMKYWEAGLWFSSGSDEYGDPKVTDDSVTVDDILDSEVRCLQEETTLLGLITAPAGSYCLKAEVEDEQELVVYFYDMQNAKTQKLFFDLLEYTREVEEPTITVKPTENGTVTVEPAKAAEGDTVTITVTPNKGYALVLNSLNVTYEYITMNVIHPTPGSDGTFTFTMPAYDVTVEAMFEEADMTLADIIGKIGGTYSSTTTDGTKQLTTKYYLGENKIIAEQIVLSSAEAESQSFARKTVIDKNGTTEYTTYNFSGNTPQYGGITGVEYPITIGDFLASGVDLTKGESDFDEITVPEDSYYVKRLEAYFYDEVNNKTQKMCTLVGTEYVVLDRIGDTEPLTLRDIIGTVGGTYSGKRQFSFQDNLFDWSCEYFLNSNLIESECKLGAGMVVMLAMKNQYSADGNRYWIAGMLDSPEYGDPEFDDSVNIEDILDSQITITQEEKTAVYTVPLMPVELSSEIPAGSYYSETLEAYFYTTGKDQTQKMWWHGVELTLGGDEPVHEHTFSDEWSYNELVHWHDATCEHTDFVSGFGKHNFTEETKDGVTTYTCSVCGYTKAVYEGGSTEGELIGGASYTGISLTLDSEIFINFYMELSEDAVKNGNMVFTVGNRTVKSEIKLNEDNGRYYFTCPLNALEMAEDVTATFTYNNNTYTMTYSVEKYVDTILAGSYSDEMKNLARKIANYGYYAQIYLDDIHTNVTIGENGYAEMEHFGGEFDIDVENAKSALKDEFIAPAKANGTSLYGRTAYLDSAIALNYYVTVDNGKEPTVVCNDKRVEIEKYKNSIYIVSIKDITATELADKFTVTINGVEFTGSVFDYCGAVITNNGEESNAAKAMAALYEYYDAAVKYAATKK